MPEKAKRMSKSRETVHELTDDELLAFGNRIVPTTMIPAIWHKITNHHYTRTAPLKAMKQGRITPMGQNRSVLYWWRDEVERAAPPEGPKRGRPSATEKAEKAG